MPIMFNGNTTLCPLTIFFVTTSTLGAIYIIIIEEKKRIRIIAFVLHCIRMPEVGTSHSIEHLFPRQILTKGKIIENVKK